MNDNPRKHFVDAVMVDEDKHEATRGQREYCNVIESKQFRVYKQLSIKTTASNSLDN